MKVSSKELCDKIVCLPYKDITHGQPYKIELHESIGPSFEKVATQQILNVVFTFNKKLGCWKAMLQGALITDRDLIHSTMLLPIYDREDHKDGVTITTDGEPLFGNLPFKAKPEVKILFTYNEALEVWEFETDDVFIEPATPGEFDFIRVLDLPPYKVAVMRKYEPDDDKHQVVVIHTDIGVHVKVTIGFGSQEICDKYFMHYRVADAQTFIDETLKMMS